jgi:hypothetical protein
VQHPPAQHHHADIAVVPLLEYIEDTCAICLDEYT